MNCAVVRSLIHPYLDGELDLVHQAEIDDHLRHCEACARSIESQRALRSTLANEGLRFTAPARVLQQAQNAIRKEIEPSFAPRWIAFAAAAVAIIVVTALVLRRPVGQPIGQELVSAHIRSLMAQHLTDVASSDQHTVKPWFTGKLDFSPPVADFKSDGFPLVGGRLDYARSRPVAALVYRRGAHVINLFVWPAAPNATVSDTVETRQGYNVVSWSRDQANFVAVSDLNAGELTQFSQLVRGRARQ